MAILHIVQYSLPQLLSGYTVRTQAIVSQQKDFGLDPIVVTSPRHPSGEDEAVEGVQHYRCKPERASRAVWRRDWGRVRALAARIEEVVEARDDVRILHAHSPVLCGLAALRAGRRLGLPVFYEVRGLWEEAIARGWSHPGGWLRYWAARAAEKRVCNQANRAIALCEGLRQEFIARGVSEGHIEVITNGVDPQAFSPREVEPGWRAKRGLAEGPLVLYLGAMREYEGMELLLDAFPAVRERHVGAQLVLVGQGEARKQVTLRAGIAGDSVALQPEVPHAEVADYYAAADVVVYPRLSTRATERVTPLKPLEAMAMGKAIVASDVGGLRELLTDGETARLFEAGSAAALAEACIELLADGPARQRLGTRAREVAVERFDWRRTVLGYMEVYREAGLRLPRVS